MVAFQWRIVWKVIFSSLGFLLLVAATFRLRSKSLVVVFRFVSPLYSQLSIEVQEKGSSSIFSARLEQLIG